MFCQVQKKNPKQTTLQKKKTTLKHFFSGFVWEVVNYKY